MSVDLIIPEKLLKRLAEARHVAVLTGAGVSAESGIKTFRDPGGLWAKLNPAELASVEGFMSNPNIVWDWYQHRREIINSTTPNPGHYAIAEMQVLFPKFSLITQNVDRLHQTAGSADVIELHGNIIENHCFSCERPFSGDVNTPDGQMPKCPHCGGMIRPSVVWFGEMLPEGAMEMASYAAESCDVFFSVGTSAEVYPAANLPVLARNSGALLVEVNPNNTMLSSYADVRIAQASGIALPELIRALKEYRSTK